MPRTIAHSCADAAEHAKFCQAWLLLDYDQNYHQTELYTYHIET